MSDELITIWDLCEYLGVKYRWVRDEAESGRLPCLKIKKDRGHGYRYLFSRATVNRILLARAAKITPPTPPYTTIFDVVQGPLS
jgi:hypothetical protein